MQEKEDVSKEGSWITNQNGSLERESLQLLVCDKKLPAS